MKETAMIDVMITEIENSEYKDHEDVIKYKDKLLARKANILMREEKTRYLTCNHMVIENNGYRCCLRCGLNDATKDIVMLSVLAEDKSLYSAKPIAICDFDLGKAIYSHILNVTEEKEANEFNSLLNTIRSNFEVKIPYDAEFFNPRYKK